MESDTLDALDLTDALPEAEAPRETIVDAPAPAQGRSTRTLTTELLPLDLISMSDADLSRARQAAQAAVNAPRLLAALEQEEQRRAEERRADHPHRRARVPQRRAGPGVLVSGRRH